MKIAYFDCFSGISGDMILGALVDAGLDQARLIEALRCLGVDGFEVSFRREVRGYLSGTRAEVKTGPEKHHRHLADLIEILENSSLEPEVKRAAAAVFNRLAEAEGAVHGIPPERVHFHEVGALDALVDIAGAAAGLHLLGVEAVFCSALPLGAGTVESAHGTLPLPAPAVAGLLKGFPVSLTGEGETTTPTGAAIVAALARPSAELSSFVLESTGYGFGGRQGQGTLPNALRLLLGRVDEEGLEEVVLLETNLDQVTGEEAGYLLERCLEAGALDAFTIPIQMKKSRPGLLFSALAPLHRLEAVRDLIFRESGTLGVRIRRVYRAVLPRETVETETAFGKIRVKKALLLGGSWKMTPEYEDAARIARERGLPLREVLARIEAELSSKGKPSAAD